MSRWYDSNYTNDKLDVQKAREFRSKYGVCSTLSEFCDISLAMLAAYVACIIPAVITAFLPIIGIPLMIIVGVLTFIRMISRKSIRDRYESQMEGYRQWMIWKMKREDGYYGGGTTAKHIIETCTAIPSFFGENKLKKLQGQLRSNPWTCDLDKMPWIDPLKFLTKTDDNHYDYTAFLEELAYYNMIYCSRKQRRATLVAFAECVAERFADGTCTSMHYFPLQSHHREPKDPISIAFPIDERQGEELREFTYHTFDSENEGQWLKQVWSNATEWYLATLQGEDYVVNLPRSYFEKKERGWRSIIDSAIEKSEPPSGYRGDKGLYRKMHSIPNWDVYIRW